MWSDASDSHWAFITLCNDVVMEAKRGDTKAGLHIFYSELSAALGGLMAIRRHTENARPTLFIDNAPAALALQRGVSSNFTANRWMAHFKEIDFEVTWVPSAAQLADPYTRPIAGKLVPLPNKGASKRSLESVLSLKAPKKGKPSEIFKQQLTKT